MNLADSPEWYRIVWILHQRNYKKASDETIIRLLDRYYENSGKRVAVPDCEQLVRQELVNSDGTIEQNLPQPFLMVLFWPQSQERGSKGAATPC